MSYDPLPTTPNLTSAALSGAVLGGPTLLTLGTPSVNNAGITVTSGTRWTVQRTGSFVLMARLVLPNDVSALYHNWYFRVNGAQSGTAAVLAPTSGSQILAYVVRSVTLNASDYIEMAGLGNGVGTWTLQAESTVDVMRVPVLNYI